MTGFPAPAADTICPVKVPSTIVFQAYESILCLSSPERVTQHLHQTVKQQPGNKHQREQNTLLLKMAQVDLMVFFPRDALTVNI